MGCATTQSKPKQLNNSTLHRSKTFANTKLPDTSPKHSKSIKVELTIKNLNINLLPKLINADEKVVIVKKKKVTNKEKMRKITELSNEDSNGEERDPKDVLLGFGYELKEEEGEESENPNIVKKLSIPCKEHL